MYVRYDGGIGVIIRIQFIPAVLLIISASSVQSDSVNEEWISRYNGPYSYKDEITGMAVDESGNVYVTGYSYGNNNILYDYATVKYDPDGIEQWTLRHNSAANGSNRARAITLGPNGGVYVTGSVGAPVSYDCCTIR